MDDSGLEASVKGVAQGIVGRLKEMAGELLEDQDLERAGLAQQHEGENRRSNEGLDRDRGSWAPVELETLHPELRSRVMAATAHADVRVVRLRHTEGDDSGDEYTVHALAGDRLVCMRLALRADGSVAETTETFLTSELVAVHVEGDEATIDVELVSGRKSLAVPAGVARALEP